MKKRDAGIYKNMRSWRKHTGLTQEQVANILGVSNSVFSEKERGVRRFKPEEIEKLVEIYKEESWIMMAFSPYDPKLSAFKRAYKLLDHMPLDVVEKWMGIGEILVSSKT